HNAAEREIAGLLDGPGEDFGIAQQLVQIIRRLRSRPVDRRERLQRIARQQRVIWGHMVPPPLWPLQNLYRGRLSRAWIDNAVAVLFQKRDQPLVENILDFDPTGAKPRGFLLDVLQVSRKGTGTLLLEADIGNLEGTKGITSQIDAMPAFRHLDPCIAATTTHQVIHRFADCGLARPEATAGRPRHLRCAAVVFSLRPDS